MVFRFLHTADIHLDSPLKGLESYQDAPIEEIRGATRRAFDNLIDLALDEEVDFVLIGGDLYDGDWRDYNTGLFFVQRMGRLQQAGIRVFLVSGNHDAAGRMTKSLTLPANVTLFATSRAESVTLDDLGVAIHGRSYAGAAVTDNLAASYPPPLAHYFNIGLLHTSLTGRIGHEAYAPCTPHDLQAKGYDYWALGHIHQREVVNKDPWIVFPGNLQGRHIRETGAKGASLVTVTEGRVSEVQQCELDVLRWAECRVEIEGCAAAEDLAERVGTALEDALAQARGKTLALRLCLQGVCPLHAELHARADQWTEEFRALAVARGSIWLEKVKFQTRSPGGPPSPDAERTPLAGLLQTIADFEVTEGDLADLIPELRILKSKLPPGIIETESLPEINQPLPADLLTEVKEMLLARLTRHGEDS